MGEPRLVVVWSFGTRPEAELAIGALEEAGIEAALQSDTVGAMRDHIAWSGMGFRILVREEDAEAARNFLAQPAAESPSDDGDEDPFSGGPSLFGGEKER